MANPMHKVIFYALDAAGALVWDHNDRAVVERTVAVADIAEAQRLYREAVLGADNFSAASLGINCDAFGADDLAGYLHALNTEARLSEEHPKEGTWIGGLTEDLAHWAETGVKTPADLAAYLDGCFAREMQKAAMAA